MSTTGVTYYKLENGYPGDVTKGCGLSGSEIDKNFHFLRGYDIKTGEIEDGKIVLTRVNGDEIVIDNLDEFVAGIADERGVKVTVNEEGSYFDKDRFELHIALHYALSGETGTTEDFVISGFRIEHDKVYVGEGLAGNAQADAPIHLSPVYKTGFYKSVDYFIDFENQESGFGLPDGKTAGDRYLTREKTTTNGLKYNASAVTDIARILESEGHGWRVPTAEDWNGLLNFYEDCDHKNHGSSTNSGFYGENAGKVLKHGSWAPDEGVTEFKILPTDIDSNEKKQTIFWSSTKDKINELTSKVFLEGEGRVYQHGRDDQPSSFAYLRLVRDYDSGEFRDVEYINGVPYECVQMIHDIDGNEVTKIWTVQNVYFSKYYENWINEHSDEINGAWAQQPGIIEEGEEDVIWYYYINEWDGKEWVKHRLDEDDCVIIKYDKDGNPIHREYRIDENGELRDRTQDNIDNVKDYVDEKIASAVTVIGEVISEVEDRIDDIEGDLSGKTQELWDAIEDANGKIQDINTEIGDIHTDINEITDDVQGIKDKDLLKKGDYIIEAVGGIKDEDGEYGIKNNSEETIITIQFSGDFSKYNPNNQASGWTISE